MIKLFSIAFSALFLLQSANIHLDDIKILSELFEHAKMHQEKYGDSLTIFISKHYGKLKESHKKQHQEEEKDHHHDPIHHDCTAQVHIDIAINTISFSFKTLQFISNKKTNFCYQDKFSTFEKQKIFQPPRV